MTWTHYAAFEKGHLDFLIFLQSSERFDESLERAVEEIREAIREPKITLSMLKRNIARALVRLQGNPLAKPADLFSIRSERAYRQCACQVDRLRPAKIASEAVDV